MIVQKTLGEKVENACRFVIILLSVQNSHCPKLLFSTINSVLNPPSGIGIGHSPELCEKFFSFFINKITCIKSHIVSNPSQKVWYLPTGPAKFELFYPISLSRSCRGKGNEETRIATNRRLYLAGGGRQTQMTFTVDV